MRLSWNEIRVRAKAFSQDWSDAAYELDLDGEALKAWSQNYGHDDVSTTYNHYVPLSAGRQQQVMLSLHNRNPTKDKNGLPDTREELVALIQDAMKSEPASFSH